MCRQEFSSEQCPDLTKEVYLQDIHCVGSLCKLYFREMPNPLLTYELYQKFTVSQDTPLCHIEITLITAFYLCLTHNYRLGFF